MNPTPVFKRAAFAALALASLSNVSRAQQAKPTTADAGDAPVVLSPFTVTSDSDRGYMSKNTISGTGTNESINKIPQTIQIANQELISDLAANDPMQALEMASGSISRRSFNVGDDNFVWGFRVMSSLKDSIPFAANAVGTMYDVDRIEVIKGPAAMMFGQNSYTGGVINYVTRKPSKTRKTSVKASYGSHNFMSAQVNTAGPITDRLRYRIDVGATDSDYSERKFGFYEDRFVGAGIEFDLSERTRLAADLSWADGNSFRPRTMMDPVTRQLLDKPDDYTINQPWTENPTTQVRGTAMLTTLLGAHVNSRTFIGYNNATNDWFRDVVGSVNLTTQMLNKTASHFDTSRHFISYGQDFVVDFNTGPLAHKLILGGDQRNEKQRNHTTAYVLTNPQFNFRDPNYSAVATSTISGTPTRTVVSSRSSGAYLQDQVSFWDDRVKLLAGLRYNEFFQRSGQLTQFTGTANVSIGDKIISRYGMIVQPFTSQDVTIYLNRSESFLFNGGVDTFNNPLKPSVGINNEIGVKGLFWNGALGVSLAVFDIELTNVRVLYTQGPNDPNPGAGGVKQDGSQTNKGFDLNVTLSKEFEHGTANFITTYYAGDTRNELGQKPVSAINNSTSFLATYAFKNGGLKRLKLGAGYVYKGERDAPGFPGTTITQVKFPDYDSYRAFASYGWKRYTVQLNVDNLTDEDYIQGGESAVWVQTDPGMTFKLTVSCLF